MIDVREVHKVHKVHKVHNHKGICGCLTGHGRGNGCNRCSSVSARCSTKAGTR